MKTALWHGTLDARSSHTLAVGWLFGILTYNIERITEEACCDPSVNQSFKTLSETCNLSGDSF